MCCSLSHHPDSPCRLKMLQHQPTLSIFHEVVYQQGVFCQALHLGWHEILELQSATERTTFCFLYKIKCDSHVTATVAVWRYAMDLHADNWTTSRCLCVETLRLYSEDALKHSVMIDDTSVGINLHWGTGTAAVLCVELSSGSPGQRTGYGSTLHMLAGIFLHFHHQTAKQRRECQVCTVTWTLGSYKTLYNNFSNGLATSRLIIAFQHFSRVATKNSSTSMVKQQNQALFIDHGEIQALFKSVRPW